MKYKDLPKGAFFKFTNPNTSCIYRKRLNGDRSLIYTGDGLEIDESTYQTNPDAEVIRLVGYVTWKEKKTTFADLSVGDQFRAFGDLIEKLDPGLSSIGAFNAMILATGKVYLVSDSIEVERA